MKQHVLSRCPKIYSTLATASTIQVNSSKSYYLNDNQTHKQFSEFITITITKHGRDSAGQGVRVVLHRFVVEPLQVLIQASCGIVDIFTEPADELPFLLEVLQASIITMCIQRTCIILLIHTFSRKGQLFSGICSMWYRRDCSDLNHISQWSQW